MIDVILPVLDEADAIPWVLERMPPGYAPVVVDNGSTDGSAEVAARLGAMVVHEPDRGFGAACYRGLVTSTADVVCFMDCDASLDPTDLPTIATPVLRGDADLVVGARVAEPRAWPLHARLANRYLAATVSRRYHLPLRDIGPMRAARRQALVELGLRDRRSGWPLEMVIAAARADWRIAERPVPYLRRRGRSKVTGTIRGTAEAAKDMRAQLREFDRR